MAAGLARSLTSENALLELGITPKAQMARMILAVAEKQLHKDSSRESEYYVTNGAAHISRLEPLEDLSLAYAEKDFDAEDFLTILIAGCPEKCNLGKSSLKRTCAQMRLWLSTKSKSKSNTVMG